jgi:hypothetical protein
VPTRQRTAGGGLGTDLKAWIQGSVDASPAVFPPATHHPLQEEDEDHAVGNEKRQDKKIRGEIFHGAALSLSSLNEIGKPVTKLEPEFFRHPGTVAGQKETRTDPAVNLLNCRWLFRWRAAS